MSGIAIWLASAVWSVLSGIARAFAALGYLKCARLPARVVSVGNIQAGGAGKTPLVARIAREAHERGLRACILCRGYGGEWEVSGGVVAPGDPAPESGLCGDEAALLHELAPQAWIGIGADRVRQFEKVQQRLRAQGAGPIDLVILDDGFQHWKIAKDAEIVAVTSARRTETLFRDFRGALKASHLVVWTKGDRTPDARGVPLAKVRFRLPPVEGGRQAIWLVTGVGDGKSAVAATEACGYEVAKHIAFPDHARYAQALVEGILKAAAREGKRVAVTGKDWVKWRELGVSRDDVLVLEPEVEFESGREEWDRLLWGTQWVR